MLATESETAPSPAVVRIEGARCPLFAAGDVALLARPIVVVVGTRRASQDGLSRAARIARELSHAGMVVASGLALGIDAAAHRAAISARGRSIAVIGTPLDEVYPATHAELQRTLARDHLVLSPFARGAPITRGNFPRRDRALAALAAAVVVIEASDGSGTLHTAAEAVRLGRPLYLLPSLLRSEATWPARFLGRPRVHVLTSTAELVGALAGAGCAP